MSRLRQFLQSERGATAVEYGLIVSLIVIAIVGAMSSFAHEANEMWNTVSVTMNENM